MSKRLKSKHLLELTFIADAQLSPDGKQVAAVETTIERPEDDAKPPEYRSHIFLYPSAGEASRRLTYSGEANTQPRFSPDGTLLAFVSSRGEGKKPQLYLLPLDGGEARQLTDFKAGVGEIVWHPSGTSLAFTSRGDFEDDGAKQGRGRIIDRLAYKGDGVGFVPSESAQIYLYDLERDKTKKLTRLSDSPTALAFSPDGDTLYFIAAQNVEAADAWESDLWSLSLLGGKAKRVATGLQRPYAVEPSPDGTLLALLAATDNANFASPTGLWIVATEGDQARLLTGELEAVPSIGSDCHYGAYPNIPAWAEDGQSLFINANREGRSGLTRIFLDGTLRTVQRGDRAVTGFHHQGGRFAFTAETPHQPGEVFFRDARGKELQLSRANTDFCTTYRLSEASPVRRAKARGGPKLAYWTLEPHKPRKDGALIVQVHGGPHTNYGYGFSFEFQLLASHGYTVVYGNPRGSSSYGADFTTTMQGRYGTIDADDVMAITDAACRAHPTPDAPVHLTGGSYGGFMTNWLVGHTNRFRSAVTQRSICNWLSFYGTSDIGYNFAAQEVGGTPWENLEKLWAQSPLRYVANVTTPLLILHSEQDHRCPIEQAEQFFVALKRLGRETRLIRFPDEGHELSRSGRPDRRLERLDAIIGWLETHP